MIHKVVINADGGSRSNPGSAAVGIVVCDEKRNNLEAYKECIGVCTNNEAEYRALIKALELAAKHTRNEVQIFMDSELVIKQVNGQYRIKAPNLYPLFLKVKDNERAFKRVTYNYVTRNNKYQVEADALVNEALDST